MTELFASITFTMVLLSSWFLECAVDQLILDVVSSTILIYCVIYSELFVHAVENRMSSGAG